MKKLPAFLLALLLIFSLTACDTIGTPNEEPSNKELSKENLSDTENSPKASSPLYFVMDGLLLGSWENDTWRSLNDTNGRSESEYSEDFYFKDILSIPHFKLYSKEAQIEDSDFALIYTSEGLGGFTDGDYTAQFAPYARESASALALSCLEIPLPTELGGEIENLKVPTYGYPLRFSYTDVDLATNSDADINPSQPFNWLDGETALDSDHDALKQLLEENNIFGKTHFDQVITVDMDGDGVPETLLFANTPRDEMGYAKVSADDGGIYSVILLRHGDGSYDTIYERYSTYTDEVSAQFTLIPKGIYDLNDDGSYEICAVMAEYEWGHSFVLSKNGNNEWDTVLRANWGL